MIALFKSTTEEFFSNELPSFDFKNFCILFRFFATTLRQKFDPIILVLRAKFSKIGQLLFLINFVCPNFLLLINHLPCNFLEQKKT